VSDLERNNLQIFHSFAGNTLDRSEVERRDPNWISSLIANPKTKFLLSKDLLFPVETTAKKLVWLDQKSLQQISNSVSEDLFYLLGIRDDVGYFALDITNLSIDLNDTWEFLEPREIALYASENEVAIMAQAKSQIYWHSSHKYCSKCGSPSMPQKGGIVRVCQNCAMQHFPRTDPVVIMLVYKEQHCLLGQNRRRANGFYSALAGFMDHAESIEEAVRREVKEESGVDVTKVIYHSSQPWPYPHSLMIGCLAEAEDTQISIDEEELSDVRWFSREEIIRSFEAQTKGESHDFYLPGSIAIAHHLIKYWAYETTF
tara:strand:+ start:43 stop:987 length:945 start_codon:yes stop_codon:yes gene_type:complete